ncbi:MAG: AarF/ABC1/UbiB kinase family protein [Nanoarchaeota archaeon]|nr:AarF/ABC1/UbiB kinase family protein [Nanoarchaeota archaeon]
MSITQTFKDINRLRQIANVLFKHELGYIVEKLDLKHQLPFSKRVKLRKISPPSSLPKHLRLSMEELSGPFIKLGQLLSLRPDLISKEYAKEFEKLQDQVPSFEYNIVKSTIESEFNKSIHDIFLKFEKQPIAAASVGQVHKAILKSGKKVAVKVQRPNIQELFKTDIDILYKLTPIIEKHYPDLKQYNLKQIIKEFEDYTQNELNYLTEAKNVEIFYKNFLYDPKIKIPLPYKDYTTKKILTLEFIDGKEISKVKLNKKEKKQVVKTVANCFLTQVLEYGVFHADPHPGNIFISKNKLVLLDFGIVGKISQDLRKKIENLFIALVQGDRVLISDSFINLNIVKQDINLEEFREDLSSHLGNYYNVSISKINISTLMYDLLTLAKKYNMKFPPNFVLLIKAIATTEGFGRDLDPDFNFVQTSRPYVNKILNKKTSSEYIFNSLKENILNFKDLITDLPLSIKSFISKKDKIKVDIEDSDIQRFSFYLNKSFNRVAMGIIIAGLVIAAALIIPSKTEPLIFNMPLISLICFIIAFLLFLSLLKSISKEKEENK